MTKSCGKGILLSAFHQDTTTAVLAQNDWLLGVNEPLTKISADNI